MAREDLGYQLGLLSGVRITTLLRLFERLPSVAPRRVPRLLAIVAGSVIGAPLAALERIGGQPGLDPETGGPPVFIIGHWRSGTTHLHNLMSRDPSWACVDMFHALAPDYSTVSRRWLQPLFEALVPAKRPMDNMEWPMGAPQEEEIPLAKMTPYSWYLQFLFPRDAVDTFDRAVLLRDAPRSAHRELKRKLLRVYESAAAQGNGRRLLLKNPVHTARIPMLLELFPQARFVFIHRSPYDVFVSTRHLHRELLSLTALQEISDDQIEANVVAMYERLQRRYLQDRSLLSESQLVEVSFADLESKPLAVLERIYERLELGDFERLRPTVAEYVRSIATYQKNRFRDLSADEIALVDHHCGFAFDEWGYDRRAPGAA